MLNEMLHLGIYICPVCERIIYKPIRGYWCPYCGVDLNHYQLIEETLANNRLTGRTETGIPYYTGKHSFKPKAFAQDMSLSAIAEVLEKLAQYEDLAEQEETDQQNDNS